MQIQFLESLGLLCGPWFASEGEHRRGTVHKHVGSEQEMRALKNEKRGLFYLIF
jgi:hypothetical protein